MDQLDSLVKNQQYPAAYIFNGAKMSFIRAKFKIFQRSVMCVGSVIIPVLDLDVTLAYMVYSYLFLYFPVCISVCFPEYSRI